MQKSDEELEVLGVVEATRPKNAQPKTRRFLILAVAAISAVLFIWSGCLLLGRLYEDRKAEEAFTGLQSMVEDVEPEENIDTDSEAKKDSNAEKFAALVAKNPDFIGWISLEGTRIDYPVMFKPDDKDYYLRRDFDGNKSDHGVPYVDEDCMLGNLLRSDNVVIYGHNMKNGSMFHALLGYTDAAFYKEHPYIRFDTIYGDALYEVFAAFSLDVEDDDFQYFNCIDMDEDSYDLYVQEVISRSYFDSGITPTYGDDLLTLSTCEYTHENGRMVVVAKEIEEA